MTELHEELVEIALKLETIAERGRLPDIQDPLDRLKQAAEEVGKSSSGSWIGYQANVYYKNLKIPPPRAHFNPEWGLMPLAFVPERTTGDWVEYDPDQVRNVIFLRAGNPDIKPAEEFQKSANIAIARYKGGLLSIIEIASSYSESKFLIDQSATISKLSPLADYEYLMSWQPERGSSKDSKAVHQGIWNPPHAKILSQVISIQTSIATITDLAEIARQVALHIQRQVGQQRRIMSESSQGTRIFIGHGHSRVWWELKDFLETTLRLEVDEFNRISAAGVPNSVQLETMLNSSMFAFLVMTAEDELPSGEFRPRENVVHEAGLFQAKLGFTRAIVLLEEGCEKFSNNAGLGHINFPKDNIRAAFEDIRSVLKREGIIKG